MNIFLPIVLPIILLVLAFTYLYKLHRLKLSSWYKGYEIKDIFKYGFYSLLKSTFIYINIIFIHNAYHDHHMIELTLFILLFAVFSVLQSAYSLSGFVSRNKLLYYSSLDYFRESYKKINSIFSGYASKFIKHVTLLAKIVIILMFVFTFVPNISIFVTANVIYIIVILFLVVISLALNNIVYFGFVSLMVFQYEPASLSLDNTNFLFATISFIIILVGTSVENRFQNKMFFLITIMPLKKFNFNLGYNIIQETKQVKVYQNIINNYYYIFYKKSGIVIVYNTLIDPKTSNLVINKMVKYGEKYLLKHNVY